ncbi:hypothetical protein KUTeg_013811 [Tegillarca granosa]|uniref:Protein kinase domain-containing protein n=1 Tax=Tegillarca granosa TaxID=220873 RepID=A0ABQ9EUS6_TEGGR|nr:hypothetical protein KUTeg_013803 [Tegillarca granosa]KAJ8308930.1 hypothetical protein KUTeg_013804 [Tegillarca granosa]KAJ8308932.1 hypothetical protein KUTeg_013806 [Tegillarca granosa]KAJ8308933.1 hypothetical protein KUTeg_013807 [Tegillarca granosa]KAJ8308937.1 hypothetical protein KUTeg_013811 [Tegillarca granosa]
MNTTLQNKGYTLGQVIGEGSYGKIRLAKIGQRSVAIKQLKKSNGMKDFIAREIKTMLSLNHENIIKVYDVIETKKNIAIVMELAEGGDLLEKVMKNTLSMEDTKRIFREIVTALAHCHSQNIVHRDLKLENVLLGKDGKVKLADFGFARKIENAQLSNTFCGSASYCPPEILQKKAYNAFAVDVWSMGVILYAMVNGGFPFEASNIHQMVECQLIKEMPVSKVTDSQCLAIIERMLEPEVEKRATIEEIMNSQFFKN